MYMKTSKKVLIILIIGASLFGYSQYAFATQIGVTITQSELLEENGDITTYNLELEFDNPSLLMLNAGETEFTILVEDKKVGDGILKPFVLPAMSKVIVEGTYQAKNNVYNSEELPHVQISGITKYDILFTSIDVPFIYFPPEEQAREFIQQN